MTSNLFLVASPFQLMCAIEARETFCSEENNHLLIIDRSPPGARQFNQISTLLSQETGWNLIDRLQETNRSAPRSVSRILQAIKLAKFHKIKHEKVFLGSGKIKYFRFLGDIFGRSTTWLDDGAASIPIISQAIKKDLWKGTQINGMPHMFSVFATEDHQLKTSGAIQNNPLAQLRSMTFIPDNTDFEHVTVLGQKLSEGGDMEREAELVALANIRSSLRDYNACYVPHRSENPSKLTKIENLGYRLRLLDYPFEQALLAARTPPKIVISWFSTALFTTAQLRPEIQLLAVRGPLNTTNTQRFQIINEVYEALENAGINVTTPENIDTALDHSR